MAQTRGLRTAAQSIYSRRRNVDVFFFIALLGYNLFFEFRRGMCAISHATFLQGPRLFFTEARLGQKR